MVVLSEVESMSSEGLEDDGAMLDIQGGGPKSALDILAAIRTAAEARDGFDLEACKGAIIEDPAIPKLLLPKCGG